MRKVTKEDRDREEHLPDCAGWEDCRCFGEYVTYVEMWDQQQHISALQDECERLRRRIAKLRSVMQNVHMDLRVASMPQSGDYATQYELGQI